jgi:hypothetical protein
LVIFVSRYSRNIRLQAWIIHKKKSSNKRRYRKGNPGQLGRRNVYPEGYFDDETTKQKKTTNKKKRKSKSKQKNNKVKKRKKQNYDIKDDETLETSNNTLLQPETVDGKVREDDSFLDGMSESIQTFGKYIYIFLYLNKKNYNTTLKLIFF